MEFISLFNELGIFGKIHVFNYVPRNKGKDTEFVYRLPAVNFEQNTSHPPKLPVQLSYDDITAENVLSTPLCQPTQNVRLKVREKDEQLKRYLLERVMGDDGTNIDHVYLGFFKKILDWEKFMGFMLNLKNLVERIGSKDYMEVIPIICAREIDPKVSRFVELYNEYYKRKPIKLFLF
jgi:hypothetical protein